MKVKIIKCSNKIWWYKNYIGSVFNVEECKGNIFYKIIDSIKHITGCTSNFIDKKDCEVIED